MINSGKIGVSRQEYYKPVTVVQLKFFMAMYLEMENRYGNSHSHLEKGLSSWRNELPNQRLPLGLNRFSAILSSSQPSPNQFEELQELFNKQFSGVWDSSAIVAHDEAVFAYQPNQATKSKAKQIGEEIPLVYFPRKPHPNGFCAYLTCNKSGLSNKPYCINMQIVHQATLSPRDT